MEPSRQLDAGTVVGRYRLVAPLGSGGMGTVWSAYDPTLDREVALKFVRPDRAGERTRARLAREAQVLARVNHPNVVAIHEIGADDGHVYIAQELVRGVDLGTWQRGRSPKDISSAFLQAARGLAAAHTAGIVHRDFKPSNVLVGDDGRVRVVDFGIARTESVEPEGDIGQTPGSHGELTETGAIAGTPLYMSPEQHLGRAPDATSDQFSFCLSLYAALYGELPFVGKTALDYALEVVAGRVRPPSPARVPGRVRKALLRGLRAGGRTPFASMDELIAALEVAPRRSREIAIASAVVLVALAGGAYVVMRAPAALCTGATRQAATAWSSPTRTIAHAAFVATGLPYADTTWRTTERALDGYTDAWSASYTEVCEATRVRGEQSERVMDLRMTCLSERLQELQVVSRTLATADRRVVEHAAQLVAALSPVTGCDDLDALASLQPAPGNPASAAAADALRAELARARVVQELHESASDLPNAQALVAKAQTTGSPALIAEAQLQLGLLQQALKMTAAAAQTWRSAYVASESAGHAGAGARIAADLALAAADLGHWDDARWWTEIARAILARRPGPDRGVEAAAAVALGQTLEAQASYDPAISELRHALELRVADGGEDSVGVAEVRAALAAALIGQAKYADAIAEFRRALAIYSRVLGPSHPQVARLHGDVGVAFQDMQQLPQALAEKQLALQLLESSEPAGSPDVVNAVDGLGTTLLDLQRYPEARVQLDRAVTLAEHLGSDDELLLADALANHAIVDAAQGHSADEVVAEMRRALAVKGHHLGPDHPEVSDLLMNIGAILRDQGDARGSVTALERAVAIDEHALGVHHVDTAAARAILGKAYFAAGDEPRARAALTTALDDLTASPDLGAIAGCRFALAQASWTADHDKARALATRARDDLAAIPTQAARLEEVKAWLAKHPR